MERWKARQHDEVEVLVRGRPFASTASLREAARGFGYTYDVEKRLEELAAMGRVKRYGPPRASELSVTWAMPDAIRVLAAKKTPAFSREEPPPVRLTIDPAHRPRRGPKKKPGPVPVPSPLKVCGRCGAAYDATGQRGRKRCASCRGEATP